MRRGTIKVEQFTDKHLGAMNRWLKRNGHVPVTMAQLGTGFIVPGVAAGFIAKVGTINVAIMDGLVTNPLCSSLVRNAALDAVVNKLIEAVPQHSIIAFSEHQSVNERALKHGFVPTDMKVLVR